MNTVLIHAILKSCSILACVFLSACAQVTTAPRVDLDSLAYPQYRQNRLELPYSLEVHNRYSFTYEPVAKSVREIFEEARKTHLAYLDSHAGQWVEEILDYILGPRTRTAEMATAHVKVTYAYEVDPKGPQLPALATGTVTLELFDRSGRLRFQKTGSSENSYWTWSREMFFNLLAEAMQGIGGELQSHPDVLALARESKAAPPVAGTVVQPPQAEIPEMKMMREEVPAQLDSRSGREPEISLSQKWALVIGLSDYSDTRIPGLRYAARDAEALHDWLVSPTGGKYAPSRTRLLLNNQATFANIRESLFTWLGSAIEEDVVLIYFAGHGSPESPHTPQNLFLLPYDVDYDRIPTTAFPMWDVETALQRFIRAKRVVVIADACHSGGVGQQFDIARRAGGSEMLNPISAGLQDLSDVGEGVCVLSASDDKQFSQESRKWGGGHGVFTWFLLQGLKGSADYNSDSSVTLGELIPYLSEHVRRETRNAQSPTVSGRFDPALSIGGRQSPAGRPTE